MITLGMKYTGPGGRENVKMKSTKKGVEMRKKTNDREENLQIGGLWGKV